jgi:ferritin-like metal-binding protein YciE
MSLSTPRDLFVHELSDIMSAENIILGMLPELQKEARSPEFKKALKEHETETRQQVKNLQKVFQVIGEKPEPTTCHGAEGLREEHDALLEEKPSPDVLEMGNVGGAAKTEHYEIATYRVLVQMAKDLGEREAATLLKENLDQETAMAKRVEAIGKELGRKAKTGVNGTAASRR